MRQAHRRGLRARIFLKRADQSEQQQCHGDREGRVLRIHEHMAVIERADRQQHERAQAGKRSADPPADAPSREQADEADHGADQTPRVEQIEREDLREQRSQRVEAAAIHVQIDERERSQVLES